jgi:uncharacterized metal-binding protein YceD (DUF177 family)
MSENTDISDWAHPLRVGELPNKRTSRYELVPDAKVRREIVLALNLLELRKLRFAVEIEPMGKKGWQLTAELGATVVQACVVTTEPVMTRIDDVVARRFVVDWQRPEGGDEFEMPADETIEELGDIIDIGEIMVEALGLAAPEYPRIAGAELKQAVFTQPGMAPMKDEDARPFAGLKALRDGLTKNDETGQN